MVSVECRFCALELTGPDPLHQSGGRGWPVQGVGVIRSKLICGFAQTIGAGHFSAIRTVDIPR